MISNAPKRPTDTVEALDKQMNELEWKRTTNSMSLAAEKDILRRIYKAQKLKNEIEAFKAFDLSIKEKKAQVVDIRATLDKLRTCLSELRNELSVVKTAAEVGCSLTELLGLKLDCPEDKLGQIIGKKGSKLKEFSEKGSVSVQVSREGGDIRLLGSFEHLAVAASDLSKVISSVTLEFGTSEIVWDFLTSKNINTFDGITKLHPDVSAIIKRKEKKIFLRGQSEDVERFKAHVLGLDVEEQSISLASRVSSFIVGRKGTTIEGLVAKHQTAINVGPVIEGEPNRLITVRGPPDNVESAMTNIRLLNEQIRDDLVAIPIEPVAREALLQNGGVGIKAIQRKVNDEKDSDIPGLLLVNVDESNIVVKGRAALLAHAVEITEEEVRQIESYIVKVDVDPSIIPKLIGKKGEQIKKIKDGKGVVIEFEREAGMVVMCACKREDVEAAEKNLMEMLAENQVERVIFDSSLYSRQIGGLLVSKGTEIRALCHMIVDDDNCQVVLRGSPEKLQEGSALIRDYLDKNFVGQMPVTTDEMQTMVNGGKDSKIAVIEKECNVRLRADRKKGAIVAQGETEHVKNAMAAVSQFLFGGDGCVVEKIEITNEVVGIVVGTKGATKARLSKKFPGVLISVDGIEHRVTLRGPEESVEGCRLEIMKLIASAQISSTVKLDGKKLDRNLPREISRSVPVVITIKDDSVLVRGFSSDVRDAIALLNLKLNGQYETRWPLQSPQFATVQDACKDSGIFEKITKETGASVSLHSADEAIVFRGKTQSLVKAAKLEFAKILEFLLDNTFALFPLPAPMMMNIGKSETLTEVSVTSGAIAYLDRDSVSIIVYGTKAEGVAAAVADLKARIEEAKKLFFVLQFALDEDWLISSMIGKKGATINSFRKETKCSIEIDSEERSISVSGGTAELVEKARETVDQFFGKLQRENVVIPIPATDLPSFIGKQGAHLTQFTEKHDVNVQILRDASSLRIRGTESAVAAAKLDLFEWLEGRASSRADNEAEEICPVKRHQIPAVIGTGGANIRMLQEKSGCRFDIDREKSIIKIRGGNAEKRSAAIEMIEQLLQEREAEATEDDAVVVETEEGEEPKAASPSRAPARQKQQRPKQEQPKEQQQQQPKRTPKQAAPSASDFPVLEGAKEGQVREQLLGGTEFASVVQGSSSVAMQEGAKIAVSPDDDNAYSMLLASNELIEEIQSRHHIPTLENIADAGTASGPIAQH
jgi:polyribonucleotide nucleotidyltransferase